MSGGTNLLTWRGSLISIGPMANFSVATSMFQDYGRPFVLGDTLAKAVRAGTYVFSACLLAGLLYSNEHDVGLTRAFEMVWEL